MTREHAELPRHRGAAGARTGREIPGCCQGSAGRKCLSARRRRQRKQPAAGSHAEIRQPFICSTPACLEKYVISALKRSFNRALRFFIFIFILSSPWREPCWWQDPSWEGGAGWGSVPSGGGSPVVQARRPACFRGGEGTGSTKPHGVCRLLGKHVVPPSPRVVPAPGLAAGSAPLGLLPGVK